MSDDIIIPKGLVVWNFDVMRQTPPPADFLLDGMIEAGKATDVFGAPGEGKTTLINFLATSIATGLHEWGGQKIKNGRVVMVGGEISGEATMQRMINDQRKQLGRNIDAETDSFAMSCLPSPEPLFAYRDGKWQLTNYGNLVTVYVESLKPVAVIVDTMTGAADFGSGGGDLVNVQYRLGKAVIWWAKRINAAVITISHTNQASATAELSERLSYRSRTGTNGWPGAMRAMMAVTRLRDEEAEKFGLEVGNKGYTAVCVSKANELPGDPTWTERVPAIFSFDRKVGLLLAKSSREIELMGGIRRITDGKKPATTTIREPDAADKALAAMLGIGKSDDF